GRLWRSRPHAGKPSMSTSTYQPFLDALDRVERELAAIPARFQDLAFRAQECALIGDAATAEALEAEARDLQVRRRAEPPAERDHIRDALHRAVQANRGG